MRLFLNGTLKIRDHKSFTDKETGSIVEYYENFISTNDGVAKFNSKQDFSPYIGKKCVWLVNANTDAKATKLYKLSLVEAQEINEEGERVVR